MILSLPLTIFQDKYLENYQRLLITDWAASLKEHIENEKNTTQLQKWLNNNNLTQEDAQNIKTNNIEAFIYSAYDRFAWINEKRLLLFHAYKTCDTYNDNGWTVERPTDLSDFNVRVIIKNPKLEHIIHLENQINDAMNSSLAWTAFMLMTIYPLKQTVGNSLKETYPIKDWHDNSDATSVPNAKRIIELYQQEYYPDHLYPAIELVQRDNEFVFRTSIHKEYYASGDYIDFQEGVLPEYTNELPSYNSALIWLALKLEEEKPLSLSINDQMLKKYPFCSPFQWPDASLDEKIRIDQGKGLSIQEIVKDCITDYPLINNTYVNEVLKQQE